MKKILILPEDNRFSRRADAARIAIGAKAKANHIKIKLFFENVTPSSVEPMSNHHGFVLESTISESLMAWTLAAAAVEKIVTFNGIKWAEKNPKNKEAQAFAGRILREYEAAIREASQVARQQIQWNPNELVREDTLHTLNNLRVLGFKTEQIPAFVNLVLRDSQYGLSANIRPLMEHALSHPSAAEVEGALQPIILGTNAISIESEPMLFTTSDFNRIYAAGSIPELQEAANALYSKLRACCEIYLFNVINSSDLDVGILVVGYGHLQKMVELFEKSNKNYEIKIMHVPLS